MLGNKREIIAVRQTLHKLISSKFFHLELSEKLTKSIRRLNPDFQDIFIIVEKDRRTDKHHEHRLNAGPYYEFGHYHQIGCPIKLDCSLAAEIILEICENPKLTRFKSGVELIIYHEREHFELPEKPLILYYPSGKIYCNSKYHFSEAFAQIMALNKVKNPIESMASALTIQHYIEDSISLKKHIATLMRHWHHFDLEREKEFNIVYQFPLSEIAISEIIRKAANFEKTLKKCLGNNKGRFRKRFTPFLL